MKKFNYIDRILRDKHGFNTKLAIVKKNLLFEQLKKKYALKEKSFHLNISFFKKIKSYKGIRHVLNLPVRGQRTHTNAKNSKKR